MGDSDLVMAASCLKIVMGHKTLTEDLLRTVPGINVNVTGSPPCSTIAGWFLGEQIEMQQNLMFIVIRVATRQD